MDLTESKAIAKKRHDYFKKLGRDVKLSDFYESIAWEAGFKDWNTYVADRKKQDDMDDNPLYQIFLKPFTDLHYALFHERPVLMRLFPNELLQDLTAAMNEIYQVIQPVELPEPVAVETDYPTNELKFFDDLEGFTKALNAVKDGPNACFKCRSTGPDIIGLNANKDLNSIGRKKQQNDQIHLCPEHAAEYMNSYNEYSNPGTEKVWDSAKVQQIFIKK